MSFWDESFFNYSVPDLNEEPPVEYLYDTIDLKVEPNADVGFDSQAPYGFVYDDCKQNNPEEVYEKKPAASKINWEPKEPAGYLVSGGGVVYALVEDCEPLAEEGGGRLQEAVEGGGPPQEVVEGCGGGGGELGVIDSCDIKVRKKENVDLKNE
ncbi:hypothetical protein R6Q57_019092 [Mikania cordata]